MTSLLDADSGPVDRLSAYLQDITGALAASDTAQKVIEIVLIPAVKALRATAGIVLLVDDTDQQMTVAGSQGYEDGPPTLWQEGPIEDHVLIADILRMKEAQYFEKAGELQEAYPELESRTGPLAVVANATLPMFLDDRPLGVIVLDFMEPYDFSPAERRFLRILSGQRAVALGQAEATRILALVDSAVKYSRTRVPAVIEVWTGDRGQGWAVLVRDNGVGFNPQYAGKLFTMFQRLHRQEEFEGAAVSLANARRIVTRHGGTMTAQGQPGEGATFGFVLPKTAH